MTDHETPLEEDLNCEGFYGYGGGFERGIADLAGRRFEEEELYCSRECPRVEPCWWRHKGRVMFLFPGGTAELQSLTHDPENPHDTQAMLEAWVKAHPGVPDPYTAISMGNIEDGLAVGLGREPKDRGPMTLPQPLTREAVVPLYIHPPND